MESPQSNESSDNDLESFFEQFPDWWAKWGTYILLVVLLVVAGISAKTFWERRNAELTEQVWSDIANASSPESFALIASEHAGEPVAALANLRAGDMYLSKALFPDATPEALAATQPSSAKPKTDSLEQAHDCYQHALDNAAAPMVVKLNALLGLATVAESKGDLKTASEIFERVKTDSGDTYPLITNQAVARLALLPRLAKPIVYGKDPEPIMPPQTAPTSAPASSATSISVEQPMVVTPTTKP